MNLAVAVGLLRLHTKSGAKAAGGWNPPFRAWTVVVLFFALSNVFLAMVPLVPPPEGQSVYEDKRIPYWVSITFLIHLYRVLTATFTAPHFRLLRRWSPWFWILVYLL